MKIKGCGWCELYDTPERWECCPLDDEGNNIVVLDNKLLYTDASYCPVCGKKLSEENNDED